MGHYDIARPPSGQLGNANPLSSDYANRLGAEAASLAVERATRAVAAARDAHEMVVIQAIAALSEDGLSARAIASALGMSKSGVSRRQRQLGDGFALAWSPEVAELVQTAWLDGPTEAGAR